jgi:hypothetical protein
MEKKVTTSKLALWLIFTAVIIISAAALFVGAKDEDPGVRSIAIGGAVGLPAIVMPFAFSSYERKAQAENEIKLAQVDNSAAVQAELAATQEQLAAAQADAKKWKAKAQKKPVPKVADIPLATAAPPPKKADTKSETQKRNTRKKGT